MRHSGSFINSVKTRAGVATMTCIGIIVGVLVAGFVAVVVLVACCMPSDKPSSSKTIADYVEREYAISGFTVCSEPQKKLCDDDAKRKDDNRDHYNYLWTVTESDGTQFSVLDYYSYSNAAFSSSRHIIDNYNNVHAKQYLQQADCHGFSLRGDVDDMHVGIWLENGFTSRSELRGLVDDLNDLASGCPQGIAIPYKLKYKHPLRSPLEDYDFGDTVGYGKFSKLNASNKLSYEECERNMLTVLVDMRYEPSLHDFTDDEIKAFVKDDGWAFGVVLSDGSCKIYDDMILGHCLSNGLSLATAYEVMKRSGYQVSGTPSHYYFKGIDGHNYEFSESYLKTLPCWYLKDGQRVPIDESAVLREEYCYHLPKKTFKDMTGIDCVTRSKAEKIIRGE